MRKNLHHRHWFSRRLGGLALTALLTCPRPATAEENTWKIGVLVCLSGPCAAEGNSSLLGLKLAAQEINRYGGVEKSKVKLVVVDSNEASNGQGAVAAYQQLRKTEGIEYFIGPTTVPAALALAPVVAADDSVTLISPSVGLPEFYEAGENIFTARGSDVSVVAKLAKWAYDKGLRNVAVFSSQHPWEQRQAASFDHEFQKLGGKIAVKVEPPSTQTNLDAEAEKVVSLKPDGILFANFSQEALAAKAVRKLNYPGRKLAILVDDAKIQEAAGTLEDTIFFGYDKPTPHFVERLRKVLNATADLPSALAYDSLYIFAKGVEKVHSQYGKDVRRSISELNTLGASGRLHFENGRANQRDILAFQVFQGKIGRMKQ